MQVKADPFRPGRYMIMNGATVIEDNLSQGAVEERLRVHRSALRARQLASNDDETLTMLTTMLRQYSESLSEWEHDRFLEWIEIHPDLTSRQRKVVHDVWDRLSR